MSTITEALTSLLQLSVMQVVSKILAKRKATLELVRVQHPDRWIKGHVMNCMPAVTQYLNPADRGANISGE